VRQYSHARLVAADEVDVLRRQHTAHFASFAQQLEPDANIGGPGRQAALTALERELDNLRAALRWCVEQGEAESGLGIGKALWTFWLARGLLTEGRAWLTQLTAAPDAAMTTEARAIGMTVSASLAYRQGSFETALEIYRDVLPVLRQAHDPWVLQHALAD